MEEGEKWEGRRRRRRRVGLVGMDWVDEGVPIGIVSPKISKLKKKNSDYICRI